MHPLAPDLTKLTDEELQKKRSELQDKMGFAYRIGNSAMVQQLQLLLSDYELEQQTRNQKIINDLQKNNKNFGNIINIS